MNNHFDQHLNVKALIEELKPKLIVECGAGSGENTRKILTLQPELGFRLVVVNDGIPSGVPIGAEWVCGVSYLELEKFADGSIDLCLIDTDHNYYTLKRELDALRPKLRQGGIVALHDTVTFGAESGKMTSYYAADAVYPYDLIEEGEKAGKSLLAAIEESKDAYSVVKESAESHGAMALVRI